MFLNLIIKKLNLKKYIVLNLIYITCASTLFGMFLDYPFEKYDKIYYTKKKLFDTDYLYRIDLPSTPNLGHVYSRFLGPTKVIRPGFQVEEAILMINIRGMHNILKDLERQLISKLMLIFQTLDLDTQLFLTLT